MTRLFITLLILGSSSFIPAQKDCTNTPLGLDGVPFNPLETTEAEVIVLIFLATDCPISNRYAPVVNRMYEAYKDKGIRFFGIYPMSSETTEDIRKHRKDFAYGFPALTDKAHCLVDQAEARVTPEVSVYRPSASGPGTWIYRGRIDDLYVDFGKWRRKPTQNDLTDTLDKILRGDPVVARRTRAVGCYIKE